jgi:sugar lactone lactonase YvrE
MDIFQWQEDTILFWPGIYLDGNTIHVYVNLYDSDGQWIQLTETSGEYYVETWYSLSITINDGYVTFGINGNETNLYHELIRPSGSSHCGARFQVFSNDPENGYVDYWVDNLVVYTSTDPTKDTILSFFDDSVGAGRIVGSGNNPRLASRRISLFRQMLEQATSFIENDMIDAAYRTLNRALLFCDGEPHPPDYIEGDAVPQLRGMIEYLMGYLTDDDGDGLSENQGDCNDTDDTIYPGAPEVCDSKDNNCHGDSGYGTVDEDCAFLETYIFERMWPELEPPLWYFNSPAYVATDHNDLVYISDYNNNQIQVFTANGDLVSKWPITKYGDYEFHLSRAITVDQDGFVYVVTYDSNSNSSILKLNPSGEIVNKIGSYADIPGNCGFSNPCAIDVDNSGNLYVTDEVNQRIEKLAPDGTITTWGSFGTGNGEFHDPTGIAVDRQNNFVYVLDSRNQRTQKFTTEGLYLAQWQSIDSVPDSGGVGIAVDQQGYVYVGNTGSNEIRKFKGDGALVTTLYNIVGGSYGIAIDSGGYIYCADFHGNRVEKIHPDGIQNWIWTSAGTANGYFDWPSDVALDSNGNVYVNDQNNARIQKFDSQGNFISTWQAASNTIAIDSSDNVYVMEGYSLLKYDANGGLITEWGSEGTGDGQFRGVNGIAVNDNGYVYVVDDGNSRIQKFTSDGKFVTKWGSEGTGDGQFILPWAIDVDSNGNVYVTDSDQSNVQKFTTHGVFVAKWEEQGIAAPRGIAIDESNNVYVCSVKGYIQKFTSEGVLITEFGDSGSEPGYIASPNGIEVDSTERIYVADTNNNRIQVFTKVSP